MGTGGGGDLNLEVVRLLRFALLGRVTAESLLAALLISSFGLGQLRVPCSLLSEGKPPFVQRHKLHTIHSKGQARALHYYFKVSDLRNYHHTHGRLQS